MKSLSCNLLLPYAHVAYMSCHIISFYLLMTCFSWRKSWPWLASLVTVAVRHVWADVKYTNGRDVFAVFKYTDCVKSNDIKL